MGSAEGFLQNHTLFSLTKLCNLTQTLSKAFTVDILRWKLNLLKSAAAYANSRLHAVKAQTLILARLLA